MQSDGKGSQFGVSSATSVGDYQSGTTEGRRDREIGSREMKMREMNKKTAKGVEQFVREHEGEEEC